MAQHERQPLLADSTVAMPYPSQMNSGPTSATGYPAETGYQTASARVPGGHPMPKAGGTATSGTHDPVMASAPPIEEMDKIAGYDSIGFSEGMYITPPTIDHSTIAEPQSGLGLLENVQQLSEVEVREALLEFVSSKCCYGKTAAQEMNISKILPTNAFHYTLETFTEKRMTNWAHNPYKGQPVDTCMNGVAPQPWQIQVPVPKLFINKSMELEVPHTSSIKQCHQCCGRGYNRCHHCSGRGFDVCDHCSGQGRKWTKHAGEHDGHWDRCFCCNGTGRRSCSHCSGHGQVMCPTCRTYGSLHWYIKLTVTWANHVSDHVVEATDLPAEHVVSADGRIVLEEDYQRLAPLTSFPDQHVNEASAMMLGKHENEYRMERIHRQRHRVRIVPISECHYTWNNHSRRFWVYGERRHTYSPDYPQRCCWGCTLL